MNPATHPCAAWEPPLLIASLEPMVMASVTACNTKEALLGYQAIILYLLSIYLSPLFIPISLFIPPGYFLYSPVTRHKGFRPDACITMPRLKVCILTANLHV